MNKFRKEVAVKDITTATTNSILAKLKAQKRAVLAKPEGQTNISMQVYVWTEYDGRFLHILGKYLDGTPKLRHYRHPMDGREIMEGKKDTLAIITPFYKSFKTKCDVLKDHPEWADYSISPLLWCNPKKRGKLLPKCWGYDMNSAYTAMAIKDMPDTSKPLGQGIVGPGEIGFLEEGDLISKGRVRRNMHVIEYDPEEPCWARFRFPLMPSPFKGYMMKRWERKKNAANAVDKANAKAEMNVVIGAMQNFNPWFRITIVGRLNNLWETLMDENTVYCNTDSIVSTVPREDLTIGTGLGEFKIEHIDSFRYEGPGGGNYQWGDGTKRHRGKSDDPIVEMFDEILFVVREK